MRFYIIIFTIIFSAEAYSITPSNLENAAQGYVFQADYFQSYRLFLESQNLTTAELKPESISVYLNTLFIVGSSNLQKDECGRLAKYKSASGLTSRYLCGLKFLEIGKVADAKEFLNGIDVSTKFYWPTQILLATIHIIENDATGALQKLDIKNLGQYEKLNMESTFYITRARVFILLNKLEEAIQSYQLVRSADVNYFDALEETAWSFFKLRRTESAHVLLDVLLSNYEGNAKKSEITISPSRYYKARYLKAYLTLVEQRVEGAANQFEELNVDFKKFKASIKNKINPKQSLSNLRLKIPRWSDSKDMTQAMEWQMNFMRDWVKPNHLVQLENELSFQMALSKEMRRARKFKNLIKDENSNYYTLLESLSKSSWTKFAKMFWDDLKMLSKGLEALQLKADVGRLEIIWLGRAQGARTVDEIIENYVQATRNFESYLPE